MEFIVKSILNKDNIDLEKELKLLDNINKHKLIDFIVKMIIKKEIDDDIWFHYLKIIFNTIEIDLYKSPDKIDLLLSKIDNSQYINSYKILYFKYNKDKLYNSIKKHIDIINTHRKLKNKLEYDVELFYETLTKTIYPIIKSFDEKKFINNLKMTSLLLKKEETSEKLWIGINSYEITNRLVLMTEVLGIKLLRLWKVNIIKYEEFVEMEFENKIEYYSSCCKRMCRQISNIMNELVIYKTVSSKFNKLLNGNSSECLEYDSDSDSSISEMSNIDLIDSENELNYNEDDILNKENDEKSLVSDYFNI